MNSTSLKTWIAAAIALFIIGAATDYYFLHLLFNEKHAEEHESFKNSDISPEPIPSPDDNFPGEKGDTTEPVAQPTAKDNFLASLKTCAPEVAAQAIATPEALITYLQKSVGVEEEQITLENYHLTLPDGSQRRVHVISSDNTNSEKKQELRFFKLDKEGYPERLPLRADATLEQLLGQGQTTRHEVRSTLKLKDGGAVSLEKHDNTIFEFQYNNHGKILSCRSTDCQCPVEAAN